MSDRNLPTEDRSPCPHCCTSMVNGRCPDPNCQMHWKSQEAKTSKEQVYRAALEKIAAHVIEPAGMARAALEEAARLAAETTTPLTECPYCKRPSDSEGGINHVGGCTALEDAGLNRLQLYMLLSRGAQKAGAQPERPVARRFESCAQHGIYMVVDPTCPVCGAAPGPAQKTPVTHEIDGNLFIRGKKP